MLMIKSLYSRLNSLIMPALYSLDVTYSSPFESKTANLR